MANSNGCPNKVGNTVDGVPLIKTKKHTREHMCGAYIKR